VATIRFARHPATVSVGDGLSMAASYWAATWELWIIPVVAVAIVNGMVTALVGTMGLDATRFDTVTGTRTYAAQALAAVPALSVAGLVGALVSLVAGWYLAAIAISGLRGRPITAGWVLGAGLRALLAELLIAAVALLLGILFVLLTVLTGGLMLISLVVLVPTAVYVAIRLVFWTLAIFDGAGIVQGFDIAWKLSRGAVRRLFGWGLLVALLGLGLSLITDVVTLASAGVPAIGTAIAAGEAMAFSMFSTIMMAVLYESQRWRSGPPPALDRPVTPAAPIDPYAPPPPPVGPYAPPPPPAAPSDPWSAPPPSSRPGGGPG
jgi:hypothetical protein